MNPEGSITNSSGSCRGNIEHSIAVRLCCKSVHGSTGSPRTDDSALEMYFAARPEPFDSPFVLSLSKGERRSATQSHRREEETMSRTYSLTLTVKRYDPDRSVTWFQTYKLDSGPILRFVDLFRRINVEQDASLAWASSCEHAQCGSCSVNVNGRPIDRKTSCRERCRSRWSPYH